MLHSVITQPYELSVVVERVAKSRVSNRSDSKKSDSGRAGIPKNSGTQKVGYFAGYRELFTPNFMSFFIRSDLGRVGYIPYLEKSGSGSPKKVGFGSGTRSTTSYLKTYYFFPFHLMKVLSICIIKSNESRKNNFSQ